jgi:hypothetical protein
VSNLTINESAVVIRAICIAFPILAGVVHCLWKKNTPGFSKAECFLVYFLTITVGLRCLIVGYLELYHSEAALAYIGWQDAPFLTVLGKSNIAFGTMGILSFWFQRGWRSATAWGYGLFILMTGMGLYNHDMYSTHSASPIMGPIIIADLTTALCLFSLLIIRRFLK